MSRETARRHVKPIAPRWWPTGKCVGWSIGLAAGLSAIAVSVGLWGYSAAYAAGEIVDEGPFDPVLYVLVGFVGTFGVTIIPVFVVVYFLSLVSAWNERSGSRGAAKS